MMIYITFSTGLDKSSKANSATSKAEICPQTLAFLTPRRSMSRISYWNNMTPNTIYQNFKHETLALVKENRVSGQTVWQLADSNLVFENQPFKTLYFLGTHINIVDSKSLSIQNPQLSHHCFIRPGKLSQFSQWKGWHKLQLCRVWLTDQSLPFHCYLLFLLRQGYLQQL